MGPDESLEIGGGYTTLNFHWPTWLNGGNGLTTHLQTIRQIRIFLEALIVLGIMTGYREAIINVVKFVFIFIKNPKNAFRRHSVPKIIPFMPWSSNNRSFSLLFVVLNLKNFFFAFLFCDCETRKNRQKMPEHLKSKHPCS